MSRIGRRILMPVAGTIIGITLLSLFLNTYLIGRVLLAQQRKVLDTVAARLCAVPWEERAQLQEQLEQEYGVTIVFTDFLPDEDSFNAALRQQLQDRGIGFIRLWLWKDHFERLQQNGSFTQLYDQGRLHYSILVRYLLEGEHVVVIAMNIPHSAQTVRAINQVSIAVFCAGGALMLLLIGLSVKKVVRPVAALTRLAGHLSKQQFGTVEVQSTDEIGVLAAEFNRMSESLQCAQQALEQKNFAMEELLSNVSHEIKTPVALIQAYGNGLQDGMDDGTFLKVILQQAKKIDQMAESLLELSRIQQRNLCRVPLDLSALLKEVIDSCRPLSDETLKWETALQPGIQIDADREQMVSVFTNLITNAIKYGVHFLKLSLKIEDGVPCFRITNGLSPDSPLDVNRIWEPFYVGELSRNKNLSGTGLGLARVQAILMRHQYSVRCVREQETLQFLITFGKQADFVPPA